MARSHVNRGRPSAKPGLAAILGAVALGAAASGGCRPGSDWLPHAPVRPARPAALPSAGAGSGLAVATRPALPLSGGTELARYVDDVLATAYLRTIERYGNAYEPGESVEDLLPKLRSTRLQRDVDPLEAHFNAGEELFEIELTQVRGFGSGEGGRPPAMHRVHRGAHGGPDTTSCRSCHHRGGDDGAGEYTEAALTGGDGKLVRSAAERNPPPLGGGGAVQILAAEITAALHKMLEINPQASAYEVSLTYQDVDFGTVRVLPGNVRDTSKLTAIDPDLVVRPFGWKGTHSTLRRFAEEAFQVHHGMQSDDLVERIELYGPMPRGASPATGALLHSLGTGKSLDPDNDLYRSELYGVHLTAISVYLALLPLPVIDPPRSADLLAAWRDGATAFKSVGCESCHKPYWLIKNPVWRERGEGDNSQADLTLDLRKDIRNGPSLRNVDTTIYDYPIYLFSDLRRHDMGPELADPERPARAAAGATAMPHSGVGDRSAPNIPAATFLTRPLWGIADSGPYLHDGRAVTLHDAIVAHGGEAQAARTAYQKLPVEKQRALQVFLMSLARPSLPEVAQ